MALVPCSDVSAAEWITSSDLPWQRLVAFGPAGFEAYARLRFLPDPVPGGQPETEVDDGAPSEHQLLRAALAVLGQHTRTPGDCYFCLWDGWGPDISGDDRGRIAPAFPPSVLCGPEAVVPHRAYFLFRGPLSEFGDWGAAEARPGRPRSHLPDPAFVWPADHAWCVANDVDPHHAGIGAASAAVEQLRAHPHLDVVPADPVEQPRHG